MDSRTRSDRRTTGIWRELDAVATAAVRIAEGHSACLSCHCYRDLAEETLLALACPADHDGVVVGSAGSGDCEPVAGAARGELEAVAANARALHDLLASKPGTHG